MTARLRPLLVTLAAAVLSAGLGAGAVAATAHPTSHARVLADGHWCC